MSKQTRTLIQRYTILKPKLERAIREDNKHIKVIKNESWIIVDKKYPEQLLRLHREALELLKDTFSGEDGEIV